MGKLFFVISIFFIGIPAISQTGELAKKSKDPSSRELAAIRAANIKKSVTTQFQYFIIKSDSTGYGYSIYADVNLFVQQTTIPALSGNKGFSDRTTAEKCAQLVIQKLKQGEMPPAITASDLKKINTIL